MSTEFNSNLNLGTVTSKKAVKQSEEIKEPTAAPIEEIEPPKIDAVPVGQSALAGKSQVGQVDNVQNDVKVFGQNPQLVALSDKFFDKAYEQLCAKNDPDAYEKACLLTSEFVNECTKK